MTGILSRFTSVTLSEVFFFGAIRNKRSLALWLSIGIPRLPAVGFSFSFLAMETANGSAPALAAKAEVRGSLLSSLLGSVGTLESVASSVTSSVPGLSPHTDAARTQVSALWGSAKPWAEFFDRRKFVPPANATELRERLMDNLTHFSANYLISFLVVSVLSVLVHPLSFVCVVLITGLYIVLFLQNQDDARLGPVAIPTKMKKPLFAVTSVVLLYLTNAVGIVGSWALFSIILSLLHAGGRVSVKEPDFESPVDAVV